MAGIPEGPVDAADEKILKQLRDRGVVILPVTRNTNYLSANFVIVDSVTNNDILLLGSLKKQLVWLKLSDKNITDGMLNSIGQLTNLTRLQLDNTTVTDKGLSSLQSLTNLQYLNLVGTSVTARGLMPLKDLARLQAVYLYKTFINSADWATLKGNFPSLPVL